MVNYQTEFLSQYISNLRISRNLSRLSYQAGNALYMNNQCVLQSREGAHFAYTVEDNYQDFQTDVFFDSAENKIELHCNCNAEAFCSHKVSALFQLHEDLSQELADEPKKGMKYTREGMIKRVMAERETKAKTEKYQLDLADNMYGEHVITNQQNRSYILTFYNFENKQGYCSCPDHQTNKLGTCKHLIYAFDEFTKLHQKKAIPAQDFPFLEVFLHPLKDYRISCFYPGKLPTEIKELVDEYFDDTDNSDSSRGREKQVSNKSLLKFNGFIREAQNFKFIKIRPEVIAKIQKVIEKQSLADLNANTKLDFDSLKASLYPYQKKGVEFIVFGKGTILADEVGLGKTIQAIVAAQFKKELFNLQSALIICPDSLIQHWEQEIKKAGKESSLVIKENTDFYEPEAYFKIIGFDDFARLAEAFDSYAPDMLIIDEAQKISSFDSELVRIVRKIKRRHLLILTDSKPQINLMQFYTMVGLIDNTVLTPLWEFSYQHCLFDSQVLDKIIGYYNQENIFRRLQSILLRREKDEVAGQLQKIRPLIVPVNLKEPQQLQHQKMAEETLFSLNKKLKTNYDWQKIGQLLNQMKAMSSLVLLSKQSQGVSAKFEEFKHFLLEKINFTNVSKKIIVFAEKDETRRQLIRFFKEHRTPTELLNSHQSEEENKTLFNRFEQLEGPAVIILQEGTMETLPDADVLIYYDLCLNQKAVENRYIYLQEKHAAQPPSVIHFLSRDSIEYSLHQLLLENEAFFNEIALFMNQSGEDLVPREETQSELRKILQNLLPEKNKITKQDAAGQISLFSQVDDKQSLSLSGEEHKVFESKANKKEVLQSEKHPIANDPVKIEKLLHDAQSFLAGLYSIQTGEELPWKAKDIDLQINEEEIILRIKRK